MKHAIKFFGIIAFAAIIGFSMTACGDKEGPIYETTSGRLTITGLTDYAGSYVQAQFSSGIRLEAFDSVAMDNRKAVLIPASGTAELKVWEVGTAPGNYEAYRNYTGSGTFEGIVYITSGAANNSNLVNQNNRVTVTATFVGGIGTGTATFE